MEEKVIEIIEKEIARFEQCNKTKAIFNHSEYIQGMIDIASRLKLITSRRAVELVKRVLKEKQRMICSEGRCKIEQQMYNEV